MTDNHYRAECCSKARAAFSELYQIISNSVLSVPSVVPPFRAFRVFSGSILKLAFLEGCQRAGLFDAIATEGAAP